LLAVLAALSALTAEEAGLAVMMAGRLLILFLLYLAVVRFRPDRRWTAAGLGVMVVIQSVVGLGQFVLQRDWGWQWLGEVALAAAPGGGSIINVGGQSWLRAYGLTPHPNILGGILVGALLILFVCFLEANGRQKVIWLMVLGVGTAALLVTYSRAAWLGGLIGGVVLLAALLKPADLRRRYGRQLAWVMIGGLMVVAVFGISQRDLLLSRLLGVENESTELRSINERVVLNELSLEIIGQRPLLGVGASHFSLAVVPPVNQMTAVEAQPVHNVPLLTAAELGVGGGVVWLWLMMAPLIITIREQSRRRLPLWVWALTAALTALAVIDLFDFYSWGWPEGRLWRWILLALWVAAMEEDMIGARPKLALQMKFSGSGVSDLGNG
jgi:hypothetical protein